MRASLFMCWNAMRNTSMLCFSSSCSLSATSAKSAKSQFHEIPARQGAKLWQHKLGDIPEQATRATGVVV